MTDYEFHSNIRHFSFTLSILFHLFVHNMPWKLIQTYYIKKLRKKNINTHVKQVDT